MLVTLLLAFAVVTPASSGSMSDDERLRRVQERRRVLAQELAQLRGQERTLLGQVEELELEIRVRGVRLRETRMVLRRTNALMDETLRGVRELESSIERTRPILAARARALYKLGELSYLRLLLSVERPTDMFTGYRFVTALARHDSERINGFRRDLAQLSELRVELEKRTQEALELRAELQRERRRLDRNRQRKTSLLTSIVEKKETHAAYLEELQEAEGKLQRLLQGLEEGEVVVPITVFKGSLGWPVAGRVRVPFGRRKHPRFDTYTVQNGIEIDAPDESPVRAVHEGTVVFAERFRGYGLMVVLDHGGKHHSLYAHLADSLVEPGQHLAAGETLGTAGGPGLEDRGLYFEIRFQGRPQDPLDWLNEPKQD